MLKTNVPARYLPVRPEYRRALSEPDDSSGRQGREGSGRQSPPRMLFSCCALPIAAVLIEDLTQDAERNGSTSKDAELGVCEAASRVQSDRMLLHDETLILSGL